MSSPPLTRRAVIAGAGTTIASAALAVPYVNAARFSSTGTDAPSQIAVEYEDLTRYYAFSGASFRLSATNWASASIAAARRIGMVTSTP